jgi:hypothetical protein
MNQQRSTATTDEFFNDIDAYPSFDEFAEYLLSGR